MTLWLSDLNTLSMEPPSVMEGWLKTSASITEKARGVCHEVRLQVLVERWETIKYNKNFVRKVLIFCYEKPAWYAQTLIPKETYQRREEQFKHLQNQAIGKILFNDPNIVRQHFVYAYLTPHNEDFHQAIQYYNMYGNSSILLSGLWARKSIFLIDGQPLSIMEIFFPNALPPISDV